MLKIRRRFWFYQFLFFRRMPEKLKLKLVSPAGSPAAVYSWPLQISVSVSVLSSQYMHTCCAVTMYLQTPSFVQISYNQSIHCSLYKNE